MTKPSEIDIAWAAGLFEGEGSWIVRSGHGNSRFPTAQITLQMCDRDVVERFASIMSCGRVTCQRRSTINSAHSDIWRWTTANRADCKRIVEMILPHLGARRSARGREVLAAASQQDGRAKGVTRRWPAAS